jgi:holo-[acyl-carrier protein] synthase
MAIGYGHRISRRIGVDLVDVGEVEESLRVHAERYLARVYTDAERRDCGTRAECLAARFAAKEATMKVLGRADEALDWRSIGVRVDARGRPSLELTGAALDLARRRGITRLSVDLTSERSLAAAVVVGAGHE